LAWVIPGDAMLPLALLALPPVSGPLPASEMEVASLRPGDRYVRLGGQSTFLLGRNPTGWEVGQFVPLLQWAHDSGERFVRIHVTVGWSMEAPPGEVDERWAEQWDQVLDTAAAQGLYVLPVFGVWGQWNDGARGEPWHYWDRNRFSAVRGGPAKAPNDLLRDTECRRLWLRWLQAVTARWSRRTYILGWEVFSELDLVTGASEAEAVDFMQHASQVIRATDPLARPITASLSGTNDWPALSASDALDFTEVHPYAADLSGEIISSVRARLKRYGKPVLIGECGLSAGPPAGSIASAPRAHVGLNHAIWAAAVSGAMNGRMLWWEDGYDQYERVDLRTPSRNASLPVARFVQGVDFAGLEPLDVQCSREITGAALGSDRLVLAWFRDTRCAAPDWPTRRVAIAEVRLPLPEDGAPARVEYHDTRTGEAVGTATAPHGAGRVVVSLPPFEDSIALKLSR